MSARRKFLKECSHIRSIARGVRATRPEAAFQMLDTALRNLINKAREWEEQRRAALPKDKKP